MVDEHITIAGKMAFGEPVGRCIYCDLDGAEAVLSDEHIIAFCLGADAYLPRSSCADCAKKTSYLEGYAGRHIFGPFRVHFGIQSRSKKIELAPIDVAFQTDRGEEIRRLPREELPTILILPVLDPPGLFHDHAPAPIERFQLWIWMEDDPSARMEQFRKPGDRRWRISLPYKPIVFARMLAKIAHALAVAHLGLDSFRPFLPALILGQDDNAAYLIGGAEPPSDPLPPDPHSEETHHHALELMMMVSPEGLKLVVVTIRLFRHIGSPAYYVIVGEALQGARDEMNPQSGDRAP